MPIGDSLAGPSPKQKRPRQVTEDSMRKAILPPELASAPFGLYANGHNDTNRQSTVRGRARCSWVNAQGC